MLEGRGLFKTYPGSGGSPVEAVRGVDLVVREGRCLGLLGPNGAGKTTTVEMLEGLCEPTKGEILFKGQPVGRGFRERVGIQFQETALPDYLTVRECLRLFGSFYPKSGDLDALVKLCSLQEFLDRDTSKLSGGQRQRVLLALALVNDPELVFLDEPTTGLDPQARRNFWDLVNSIKAQGRTVLLTTHYMEEAYVLCDEIAIMDRGRVIAEGKPDVLLATHFKGSTVELGEKSIRTEDLPGTLRGLLDEGQDLSGLRVRAPSLEDLFLALTGKDLRG